MSVDSNDPSDPTQTPPLMAEPPTFEPSDGTEPFMDNPDNKPAKEWTQRDFSTQMDEAGSIRKMRAHTSVFGRFAMVLLVGGAVILGIVYWKRNDAYSHRMDGVDAAGALNLSRDAMLSKLREELVKAEYDDVRERIMLNLGYFKDDKAVPELINQLSRPGIVRRAAAVALAQIGYPAASPARPALLAALPKTDARDKPQVVWALAVLRESKASDEILDMFSKGLLQGQKGFEPKVITDVLGPQRLSSDALVNHPKEAVRVLVAQALAEAPPQDALPALTRMLKQELARPANQQSGEVIRSAAAGLARTGDGNAAAPLLDVLKQIPSMKPGILDALAHSTSAQGIAVLLAKTDDVSTRQSLVKILRATHDPQAAEALLLATQDGDVLVRSAAALGLADLGDLRAAPALVAIGKDDDESLAKEALSALGTLKSDSVAAELVGMLGKYPTRKASILKALSLSHSAAAADAARRELKGDDMQAAASALAAMKDAGAYKALSALIPRPKAVDMSEPKVENETLFRNRSVAIDVIARFGKADVANKLAAVVADAKDDGRLRRGAAIAWGALVSDDDIRSLIANIASKDDDTQRHFGYALWQVPRPALSAEFLALAAQNKSQDLQRHAGIALGYIASDANDAALIKLLDKPEARRGAGYAIMLGGSEQAAQKLVEVLNEDRELQDVLQSSVLEEDEHWFSLITQGAFSSGQIFRRIRVEEILREGDQVHRYGYAWTELMSRLAAGYDGPDGLFPRDIREKLVEALRGPGADKRQLAAAALAGMNERGLLFATRDHTGPGSDEARAALRDLVAQ